MKRPAEVYAPSPRPYGGLPELAYPLHDRDVLVTACGRICMHRKRINVSTVLAGQRLGIKEVDDGIWIVSFMSYDLASSIWSRRPCNPSTTHSARGCHPCLRYDPLPCLRAGQCYLVSAVGIRTHDPNLGKVGNHPQQQPYGSDHRKVDSPPHEFKRSPF